MGTGGWGPGQMEMCGNAKDESRVERSAGLSPLAHGNRPRDKPLG